jgi:hypothetical protein
MILKPENNYKNLRDSSHERSSFKVKMHAKSDLKKKYTHIYLYMYKLVSGGTYFHCFQALSAGWLVGPSPGYYCMYKVESILIKAMRCLRARS